MNLTQKPSELTDYALEVIHHQARQAVGKAGYTKNNLDDLKQDLILDLLERLPKFDPAKASYNTFVACVVSRKLSNLLRDRQTPMRDHRREVCSLNEEIDAHEESVPRLATISQDELDIRTGKYRQTAEERAFLQMDINATLANLPAYLRQAAEMLQTESVAQVARELGISRRTFREKHLAQLQEAFATRGMDIYLR